MGALKRYVLARIPRGEPTKILVQYSSLSVGAVVVGAFLAKFAYLPFLLEHANKHFALPFLYCTSTKDVSIEFLQYISADLLCAILLLFASFSLLNYLCSDLILTFQGLRLGIAISAFVALRDTEYRGESFGLLLLRLGTTFFLICCACVLSRCFYKFRSSEPILFTPRLILTFIGIFLVLIAFIFVVNILYCGFIFLI